MPLESTPLLPLDPPGRFAIEGRGLVRRYGAVTALENVELTVCQGEFFSLLGPSGCGKTTLLRLLAGLDQPDSGMLRINGTDALGVPAHQRPVNTVFQSYALFPHLTVAENIGFGLRMKRVSKPELTRRVGEVVELVQINSLLRRMPSELSGGERQRVALARAVVNEPSILLLDEPLGALDLKLRKELQSELRSLQRRLGITFVYVTHDQDEALSLSDRIAVLRAGRIEQVGTGQALYEHPCNRFVADFLGGCNLLEATADGSEFVTTALGRVRLGSSSAVTGKITLAIRPEKLSFSTEVEGENTIAAMVREVRYGGSETHFTLEVSGQVLCTTVLNAMAGSVRPAVGDSVLITLPADALVVLAD